jgi:hypothetical protein
MTFLRSVAGYALGVNDQIRITSIRNELNMFHLNFRIQGNRLNWACHAERMEPSRIPKQLVV